MGRTRLTMTPVEKQTVRRFTVRVGELSSDSDEESYGRLNWRSCTVNRFAWEDNESSDDESCCLLGSSARRQFLSLERNLAAIDQEEHGLCREASTSRIEACSTFLSRDSTLQEQSHREQESLLASLRKQHQEAYHRDQIGLRQLEKQIEDEKEIRRIAEEKRRLLDEQDRRRREAWLEAQRVAEEQKRAAELEQEALRARHQKELEENEKLLHRLTEISNADALEYRKSLALFLDSYNDALKPFCEDRSMKDVRRGTKKFITLSVQQISATQEQVKKKSMSLLEFLSQQHGLQQKFALVTLAAKIVSQCEAQITLLPSFAFPLAEVSVSIIRAFPDFWKLLHGMLQIECPFVVPVVFQPGERASKDMGYYQSMGFRIEDTEEASVKVENEEDYVNRQQGYMRLYAAILQADNTPDLTTAFLGRAWTFLSHLLNCIPASRYSATALDAFLSTAGYRMYASFHRQFEKLLLYVEDFFLKDLKETRDADCSAVAARLERYIQLREYQREPKGRTMPLRDSSSFNRA